MCDPSPVRNWLIGPAATVASAAAIALGAAAVNNTGWYAWLAPAGMLVAAGLAGLAVVFCGMAIDALDVFCACAGSRCAGPCSNLRNTLNAARVVLGIQATACLAAAAIAWIPWAGSAPIYVIVGALIIQVGLVISAIVFMSQLASCQTDTVPAPPAPKAPPVGTGPVG